jgi:hypothetical protein
MGGYVTGIDVNGAQPARAVGPAEKPQHTISGVRLTAELRELERNKIVDEMHANPGRVSDSPAQTVAGKSYPAVQYRGDYGTFIVLFDPATNPYGTKQVPPKVEEVDGKWSVTEGGRTIEAYSLDNPHATGYIIPYIPDAKFGFVTDIWSPAPNIPPANPATTALVKGIQNMGIAMDRMAGGHGGVGNFADLAKTVQ